MYLERLLQLEKAKGITDELDNNIGSHLVVF